MTERGESRIAARRSSALSDGGADYASRRAELVRIAANVFHEKGYAATSLADVAAIFGADRASLYYYVGGKEELLREALTGVAVGNVERAEAIVASDADPVTRLHALIELMIRSLVDDYPAIQVYIREDLDALELRDPEWAPMMRQLRERMEACFTETIARGAAAGVIRDDVPAALLANAIFGMMLWTHRWFVPGAQHTADDLIRAFSAVFFDGVRPLH